MNNTNTSSNANTNLIVNGFTIKPLEGDNFHKFAIETKRDGTVKFTNQKDARRWARRNNPL